MMDPGMQIPPNPSVFWGEVILEELARGGVRHVCVSPGSRSTPLTLAAAAHPDLHVHNHIDERSSAFFALGLAKATGQPVALVCTSGSALAHYLPAFIEAYHTRQPLIALSADRPVELIHTGAGQTIDQHHVLSSHTRLSLHLENPDLAPQSVRRLRTTLQRTLSTARGHISSAAIPGPVHLNIPFKEPLAPVEHEADSVAHLFETHLTDALGRENEKPWIIHHFPQNSIDTSSLAPLLELLQQARRPVIVCGPQEPSQLRSCQDFVQRVSQLTLELGALLLADPVSQARQLLDEQVATHAIATYDTLLRNQELRKSAHFAPDLIVRFGAQPTSKSYRFWREAQPHVMEILVDPYGEVLDHPQLSSHIVTAEPCALLEAILEEGVLRTCAPTDADWLDRWQRAHRLTLDAILHDLTQIEPLWEGQIAHTATTYLEESEDLFVASSMPIRDLDTCMQQVLGAHTHVMWSNRGANGIDGLIATASGISAARQRRCTLLIGDVAFLHDASSLLTATRGADPDTPIRLRILIVNNHGGGIFSFLPIARTDSPHFHEHFITPHQVDFAPLCQAYGVPHTRVSNLDDLRAALCHETPITRVHHVEVIEVLVDRTHNVEVHQKLWARTSILMEGAFDL